MGRIVFLSNRLPVTVLKDEEGKLHYIESLGGLATGLKSFHQQADSVWIGWPGILDEEITTTEKSEIEKTLRKKYQCIPVFLTKNHIEQYYHGFSNRTIWPLFHYFVGKTEYDFSTWAAYQEVNHRFLAIAEKNLQPNDLVWIHDYQLLLLPEMIRQKYPQTKIGLFLHIPFPSSEIFRLLIWRNEILTGMLGADLIGFHTYDYMWHFLSSVRRLLGYEYRLDKILCNGRYVHVNVFPMGIDYERFFNAPTQPLPAEDSAPNLQIAKGMKKILSVDRLDYSKGIPQRIKAFKALLKNFPEYRGKVFFYLIVAPSRVEVDSYHQLLKEIRELVSEVNGRFGTLKWMPIWFFFRSFPQEALIHYYRHADVLLVTPLRDGMNLVVKEYIAARNDYQGMAVISETAGAAIELGEAIIVNPNDYNHIAQGIKKALEMPAEEKESRNRAMHNRLKRYNVNFWGKEFLTALSITGTLTDEEELPGRAEDEFAEIKKAWQQAEKRLLLLDYDGTLVGFTSYPEAARPDKELKHLLSALAHDPHNTVVIISGRERNFLWKWLGKLKLHFVASHGLWVHHPGQEDWILTASHDNDWKPVVRQILQNFTDRIPGSFIEEKTYALAWHYRRCDPQIVEMKIPEIRETLNSMIHSTTLGIQEGKKVLEVKDVAVNKGHAVTNFIHRQHFDFILAAGDDHTDEDMFTVLPPRAYSIKIGMEKTAARYRADSWYSLRTILKKLIGE